MFLPFQVLLDDLNVFLFVLLHGVFEHMYGLNALCHVCIYALALQNGHNALCLGLGIHFSASGASSASWDEYPIAGASALVGIFTRAQFPIIMLPQRLFIPCFLRFTIPQDRHISSPVPGVGHSWRNYRSLIAHPLCSTVTGDVPVYLGVNFD